MYSNNYILYCACFMSCFCVIYFFFNDTATTEFYTSDHTLSLHDALPIWPFRHPRQDDPAQRPPRRGRGERDDAQAASEPGARRRSEEHTSELQSLMRISYAVFCLKKKTKNNNQPHVQMYQI